MYCPQTHFQLVKMALQIYIPILLRDSLTMERLSPWNLPKLWDHVPIGTKSFYPTYANLLTIWYENPTGIVKMWCWYTRMWCDPAKAIMLATYSPHSCFLNSGWLLPPTQAATVAKKGFPKLSQKSEFTLAFDHFLCFQ